MSRQPSPAQRAVQITFVLKGHLKHVQVAYIRVAALLAKLRDERLYRALGHQTMEEYAAARLGLQHSALYHYLQVYDWIRESHPAWLARRPKGFIPELSDAAALMWIERRLRDPRLPAAARAELEALRAKALAGRLTAAEFRAMRARMRGTAAPLRALVARLRALRQAPRCTTSRRPSRPRSGSRPPPATGGAPPASLLEHSRRVRTYGLGPWMTAALAGRPRLWRNDTTCGMLDTWPSRIRSPTENSYSR